jgi:transcriptional activator of cad operon
MSAKLQVPFQLGEWLVDPSLDTISRGAQTTKLEPRMMRLLTCLADSPGAVVSQERLLSEVWSGVIVGPASVYQAVSQLRRLLGDLDPQPNYIATVPRKGYRLIAPVRPGDPTLPVAPTQALAPAPAAQNVPAAPGGPIPPAPGDSRPRRRWRLLLILAVVPGAAFVVWTGWHALGRRVATTEQGPSIVVLPFTDMSKEKLDQPFCDGLTEELSNWLAQIPTLHVVARTSAFAFRGLNEDARAIGNALGATHVLEGSMRRSDDHMRVIVQLIDARNGYQVWSSEYDRPLEDAIRIQEDIARSVADNLAIRLTEDTAQRFAARRSASPQAYRLFLLARRDQQERRPEANAHAIELFRQSLQADPQFALADVGLAYAIVNELHVNGRSISEVSATAEPLLERAAQLEPDLSELYAVRAALREEQGRSDEALADLNRAIVLNPNDSWAFAELARLHISQGEPQPALQYVMRALALDPLDYVLHARQCLVLQDLARFAQASAACERARALQGPGGWDLVVSEWLAWSQGDLVQALSWNSAALKTDPSSIDLYQRRAEFLLTLGLAAEARAVLEQARVATRDEEAVNAGLAQVSFVEGGADALRAQLVASRLDESQHSQALINAAWLHLLIGEVPAARASMLRAMQAEDFDASQLNSPWRARWGESDLLLLAYLEQASGASVAGAQHLRELDQLLEQLIKNGDERYGIYKLKAAVLALQGHGDEAMQALSHAFELGWRDSWRAQHEPYFDPLRGRSDFRGLLARAEAANRRMRSTLQSER